MWSQAQSNHTLMYAGISVWVEPCIIKRLRDILGCTLIGFYEGGKGGKWQLAKACEGKINDHTQKYYTAAYLG